MSKRYSFLFPGTKEMFLNQLNEFYSYDQKTFHVNGYIIELSENEIRFGVARGGHSGGYWFIPTITELDGKTMFCGTIQYISPYSSEKGIKKVIISVEEILLSIILLPIVLIAKLCLFFSWVIRKVLKQPKPKEETEEDKLYDLMENHLNCMRQ